MQDSQDKNEQDTKLENEQAFQKPLTDSPVKNMPSSARERAQWRMGRRDNP